MSQSDRGRLVWNHSTHIPGLIPLLETLLDQQPAVRTVTPGVLSTVRGRTDKLQLRVSVPIRGGYKLMARKGKSAQEVFILTHLQQDGLEAAIAQAMQSRRL